MYTQQALKSDAENAVRVELCMNRTGEILRYVGTTSVVRDLERLSHVIEGPEKPVNYWGFRYALTTYHSISNQLIALCVEATVQLSVSEPQVYETP